MPIDPELVEAVDLYLSHLRVVMLERLEIGEREHHGAWRRLTVTEIRHQRADEEADYHVYSAMEQWLASKGIRTADEPEGFTYAP